MYDFYTPILYVSSSNHLYYFFCIIFLHCSSIIDRLVVYFYQPEKTQVYTYTGPGTYFYVYLFCSPWLVTKDIDIRFFAYISLSTHIYEWPSTFFFFPLFFHSPFSLCITNSLYCTAIDYQLLSVTTTNLQVRVILLSCFILFLHKTTIFLLSLSYLLESNIIYL